MPFNFERILFDKSVIHQIKILGEKLVTEMILFSIAYWDRIIIIK